MISVRYEKVIAASPQQILTKLLDHGALSDLFNAKFKVIEPANSTEIPGGKGCIRQVSVLGVRFLEQIILADTSGIEYRVLNDYPVKSHQGSIRFTPTKNGTSVHYTISCAAPWYLPERLLTYLLQNDIETCLDKLGVIYDPR